MTRSALQHGDAMAGAREAERRGQPANSGAGDDDRRAFAVRATSGSGGDLIDAFGRIGPAMQRGVIDVKRRAIGADRLVRGAHVDEHMRMIERRQRPDAHELLGADAHLRERRAIMDSGAWNGRTSVLLFRFGAGSGVCAYRYNAGRRPWVEGADAAGEIKVFFFFWKMIIEMLF